MKEYLIYGKTFTTVLVGDYEKVGGEVIIDFCVEANNEQEAIQIASDRHGVDSCYLTAIEVAKENTKENVVDRLIATDIIWDLEDEDDEEELPDTIEIPQGMVDEDEISDYISDSTGYCHNGFTLLECKEI